MSNPLKNMTPDDAKAVHVLLAGVALHAIVSSGRVTAPTTAVREAFEVADVFFAEAMKRLL